MGQRVTRERIQKKIVDEQFQVLEGTTTTICILTLANGYTVLGTSACVDPENFDANVGRELAYEAAFQNVWPLEGYLLQQELWIKRHLEEAGT